MPQKTIEEVFDTLFQSTGSTWITQSMLEKFFAEVVYLATGERRSMYDVMDKMLLTDTKHIDVDTRFGGTRANPALTGGISEITTENFTPAEFRVGFLKGIIAELYNMFAEMNVKRGSLVGSGNGIRKNKALILAAEEMFGAEMKIPAHMEEAAFGAALFGMTAVGSFGTAEEIKAIIKYS